MTEKKMEAEEKLKEAQVEIAHKNARIRELEDILRNLSGGQLPTEANDSLERGLRQSHDKSQISDLN